MEQIERALEKAEAQRKVRLSETSLPIEACTPASLSSNSVVYNETQVRAVSPRILRDRRVIAESGGGTTADRFRMLRAQILQHLSGTGGRSLGVSSPNPQEGKTLTAVNLAISLAKDVNHTVLLVDLDLRRPSLADYFGLKPQNGLTDYLFKQAYLSDCLVNPGIERLVLLPAGEPLLNSSEMIASPKMLHLAQELKTRYPDRLVIYDLPPLLSSDDSMVFLPHVDAALLVVQEGKTKAGEVQRALGLLEGNDLIGTVLNRSKETDFYPYY